MTAMIKGEGFNAAAVQGEGVSEGRGAQGGQVIRK